MRRGEGRIKKEGGQKDQEEKKRKTKGATIIGIGWATHQPRTEKKEAASKESSLK